MWRTETLPGRRLKLNENLGSLSGCLNTGGGWRLCLPAAGHIWMHSSSLWSLSIRTVVVGTSLLGSSCLSRAENVRADAP